MARRIRKTLWSRSFQRNLNAIARTAMRAGSKAITKAIRSTTPAAKTIAPAILRRASKPGQRAAATQPRSDRWISGIAMTAAGARRWRLYRPPGVQRTERLPLVVMLHGCGQDASTFAASSRMNRIAARERFLVLYPEQDRLHNAQGCWNWFETRSGRAQGEAGIIDAAIDQVCLQQPVDPGRIALAGFSAGAGMAALLATRHPARFAAVAMHSGIGPGVAHSTATALSAMRGRRVAAPLPVNAIASVLPALLVIHGSADHVVAAGNGAAAARLWAECTGATAAAARQVQRGARYPLTLTDYKMKNGLVAATLCEVAGLGHAWSGGAAAHRHGDPKGPDASRMIWSFCAKQFAKVSTAKLS